MTNNINDITINNYCDSIGATTLQRGKILSVLSKEYNFNGVWQTRAKFIQDAVDGLFK